MRAQLIVALVVGLIVVAVPLYLWRRPKSLANAAGTDASASASAGASSAPPDPTQKLVDAALDGGVQANGVTLGKVWIDSCQRPGPGKTPPEQCDRQPFFEEALIKAILENTACAPRMPKGGSISFAMKIDHQKKRVNVFAGKSGTVGRKRANEMLKCIQRSLPTPDWDAVAHQHSRYVVAVLATYPPTDKSSQ